MGLTESSYTWGNDYKEYTTKKDVELILSNYQNAEYLKEKIEKLEDEIKNLKDTNEKLLKDNERLINEKNIKDIDEIDSYINEKIINEYVNGMIKEGKITPMTSQ